MRNCARWYYFHYFCPFSKIWHNRCNWIWRIRVKVISSITSAKRVDRIAFEYPYARARWASNKEIVTAINYISVQISQKVLFDIRSAYQLRNPSQHWDFQSSQSCSQLGKQSNANHAGFIHHELNFRRFSTNYFPQPFLSQKKVTTYIYLKVSVPYTNYKSFISSVYY